MRKETESQGEWQANLDEAREILSEIRGALISSQLMIRSTVDPDERIIFVGEWRLAVREEVALTKDVIAPAKIGLGLPLTDRKQEGRVIERAGIISERFGGTIEEGKEIARRHIRFSKKIQRRLGV